MKRAWHGRRLQHNVKYNGVEIQSAAISLVRAADFGYLKLIKAKYAHNPLDAVPNLWEGEDGMMTHVPMFPMPRVVENGRVFIATGAGLSRDSDMSGDSDLDIPETSPDACRNAAAELRFRGMERKFWLRMAKFYDSLEMINRSTITVRSRLIGHNEKIRKQARNQLRNLCTKTQSAMLKLKLAEKVFNKNKYSNLFMGMPAPVKLRFQRLYGLNGKLPRHMDNIRHRYSYVVSKLQEVIDKYCEKPLTGELKIIAGIVVERNSKKNPVLGHDSAAKPSEVTSEAKDIAKEAEDSLPPKDKFWKKVAELRSAVHETAVCFGKLDEIKNPESYSEFKATGWDFYKELLTARKNIITGLSTLSKLKEEMQIENYEEMEVFTAEDLANLAITDVTPDKSLEVAEAILNKQKAECLRIQCQKYPILEMFGFSKSLGVEPAPVGQNLRPVRLCAHSRADVNIAEILSFGLGSPGKGKDTGQGFNSDVEEQAETSHEMVTSNSLVETTGDSIRVTVDADAKGSELEDSSMHVDDINSVSLFMKNFGEDAFSGIAQGSSVTEEFIEKERKYWDELQKLSRKAEKAVKLCRNKSTKHSYGKKWMRTTMKTLHCKMKELLRCYEAKKTEGFQAGYCRHVTYENLEFCPMSTARVLVKSLDQIKERLDTAYKHYKEVAEKFQMPEMLKL